MPPPSCSTCTTRTRPSQRTGQYRFTPPIHVIVAFHQALQEFWAEGGVAGRGGRYAENGRILIEGMRALGFETLLPPALQAPIIVTFHMPRRPELRLPALLRRAQGARLRDLSRQADGRGFLPHRLHRPALSASDMHGALGAIREALAEMGVRLTPAKAA